MNSGILKEEAIIRGSFQLRESLTPEEREEVLEEIKEIFNVSSFQEEEECHYFRFIEIIPRIEPDEVKRTFLYLKHNLIVAEVEMWFLREPDFKFSLGGEEVSYKLKV